MIENNISLEAIAEKHWFDILKVKDYFSENGVKLSHNYINGYSLPKDLLADILRYAKNQALNAKNFSSLNWKKNCYPYFLKASQRLFGLADKSAKTVSNYFKKELNSDKTI